MVGPRQYRCRRGQDLVTDDFGSRNDSAAGGIRIFLDQQKRSSLPHLDEWVCIETLPIIFDHLESACTIAKRDVPMVTVPERSHQDIRHFARDHLENERQQRTSPRYRYFARDASDFVLYLLQPARNERNASGESGLESSYDGEFFFDRQPRRNQSLLVTGAMDGQTRRLLRQQSIRECPTVQSAIVSYLESIRVGT